MIPLVVCQTNTSISYLAAILILCVAFILGAFSGSYFRVVGAFKFYSLAFLLGAMLPVTMFLGAWPFDPKWNDDCGATPDPNIWPIYAALAFPIVVCLSAALTRSMRPAA